MTIRSKQLYTKAGRFQKRRVNAAATEFSRLDAHLGSGAAHERAWSRFWRAHCHHPFLSRLSRENARTHAASPIESIAYANGGRKTMSTGAARSYGAEGIGERLPRSVG